MKHLLALPLGVLVSVGALACGHTGQTGPGSQAASTGTSESSTSARGWEARRSGADDYDEDDGNARAVNSDHDSDDGLKPTDTDGDSDSAGGSAYDRDDRSALDYGQAAPAPVRRQIVALVEGYYSAAAKGDGARACSLVYRSLAKTFSQDLGQGGPRYLRGLSTCAAVLSRIFSDNHAQLAAYDSALTVPTVRVSKGLGIALLASGRLPGRQIETIREQGTWKIFALTDKELP